MNLLTLPVSFQETGEKTPEKRRWPERTPGHLRFSGILPTGVRRYDQLQHSQFAVSSKPQAGQGFTPDQRLSALIFDEFLLLRPIPNNV